MAKIYIIDEGDEMELRALLQESKRLIEDLRFSFPSIATVIASVVTVIERLIDKLPVEYIR